MNCFDVVVTLRVTRHAFAQTTDLFEHSSDFEVIFHKSGTIQIIQL